MSTKKKARSRVEEELDEMLTAGLGRPFGRPAPGPETAAMRALREKLRLPKRPLPVLADEKDRVTLNPSQAAVVLGLLDSQDYKGASEALAHYVPAVPGRREGWQLWAIRAIAVVDAQKTRWGQLAGESGAIQTRAEEVAAEAMRQDELRVDRFVPLVGGQLFTDLELVLEDFLKQVERAAKTGRARAGRVRRKDLVAAVGAAVSALAQIQGLARLALTKPGLKARERGG